jgi:hypothetical protein
VYRSGWARLLTDKVMQSITSLDKCAIYAIHRITWEVRYLCNPSHHLRSALLCVTTQWVWGNSLLTFRDNLWVPSSKVGKATYRSYVQRCGRELTLEDGTDRLSRNVSNELPHTHCVMTQKSARHIRFATEASSRVTSLVIPFHHLRYLVITCRNLSSLVITCHPLPSLAITYQLLSSLVVTCHRL